MAFSFANKGKEQKALSPKQQKVKTILNWVVSVLCVLIIIAALFISILTITRTASKSEDGKPGYASIGKSIFMVVNTDSMEPTIKAHSLIVVKEFKGDISDLSVGQVVTYYSYQRLTDGYGYVFITHRIQSISGNTVLVVGDNPDTAGKTETVHISNIVATWGTPASQNADGSFNVNKDNMGKNMGKIGEFVYKLQNDRVVYFCAIVLPLILLFVIYAFILVRTLVINKIDATRKEAAAQSASGLSEEDKEALRKEYLASLAAENAANSDAVGDSEKVDSPDEVISDDSADSSDISDGQN